MWKFLVKNQSIEILEREVLADHQIQYVQFKFIFDGDWKKFHKVVQFSQCDEIYSIVLGFDGTTCYLPAELHVGAVKMSVFGYDAEADTTVRATTVPVSLNIRESGFVGDDDIPIPPTPDLYTQLLQKISEIQAGIDGKDGLSAYEIAKENGFVGTVTEWLESLKGADGLPGKDGVDGKNGIDGKDGRDGADGRDGVDGITPDMTQYPTTSAVELIIQKITNPLSLKSHEHENKPILDATTASYTLEEQQKLADFKPSDYATKQALADETLAIREAMIPLTRELHSHENMAALDLLTAEYLDLLDGLQQFEDSTKYDIQTIRESVEPVISQAHWHHNKKRVKNTGIVPQYYVESDHEAIIPKEIFLMVQEEMARRATTQIVFGKKGYSANHAFSQIVFCADCGSLFRRVHWNNRSKKSIVWRCTTRLKQKDDCRARTVGEETLKAAFLDALNEMVGESDIYLKRLRENLEIAINTVNPTSAEALSAKMAALQQELINRTKRRENYDDITEKILHLREVQKQNGMDDVTQKEHTKRIKELQKFIQSQPSEITKFDEALVKKLLEKVVVHDEYLEFHFKSGVTISIEK